MEQNELGRRDHDEPNWEALFLNELMTERRFYLKNTLQCLGITRM